MFSDRIEAGQRLGARLAAAGYERPAVYALPRGGVPVALEVARALQAPLDLILVRKLGLPYQPELALGAVAEGEPPAVYINDRVWRFAGVSDGELEAVKRRELAELERRRARYLEGRERVSATGRTAILVDDGIATGATARVALRALRGARPRWLVLATPVAPPETVEAMAQEADEVVCLATPAPFHAISLYYRRFEQLTDEQVVAYLAEAPVEAPGPPAGEG